MLELLKAAILGIVQGLTEFLPVSSSGHIELSKVILDYDPSGEQSIMMTVVLHFATAVATLWVFRRDVAEIIRGLFSGVRQDVAFTLKIILSMVPAAIVGLVFEKQLDEFFDGRLMLVGAMLIITGLLLFVTDRARETDRNVSYVSALVIGIAQAIAILPGISRSGATISTAVLLGIDRERSARFSFLMVVPLILGKMAKEVFVDGDLTLESSGIGQYVVGFLAALFTGIIACKLMIRLVRESKLVYFAVYCFFVGSLAMAYAYFSA